MLSGVVSITFRPLKPRGKASGAPCVGGCVGPDPVGYFGQEKNVLFLPIIELRFFDWTSQSLVGRPAAVLSIFS